MYLLYFCITISYKTLLVTVNPHAMPVDIGITIKPVPVTDNLIELDVVAIITIVSKDFNILDNVLYFFIAFLIYYFYL